MTFRDRLISTLRAIAPLFEVDGVMVIGSEVPNLLEDGASSTLVVSEDVDVAVPVGVHQRVKERLPLIHGLSPSPEEPSVWTPLDDAMIELNLVGLDPSLRDASESYVLEDDQLPLLVFGNLGLLRAGLDVDVDGLRVPLPAIAGMVLEKLVTDRSGVKGDRDLLVALGVIQQAQPNDLDEATRTYSSLPSEARHTVRSNLTILSLMQPHANMPDPVAGRARVAALLQRFERADGGD